MQYYVEITLLPCAEIPLYFLWEKTYQQIHLALVESQDETGRVKIGASFPHYQHDAKKRYLGDKLRLFSTREGLLENLQLTRWLTRLSDYVHITSIRAVPKKIKGYAFFKRIQTKNNNERLARRKSRRENIDYQQAVSALKDRKEIHSTAPFLRARSLSSGENYCIFIACLKTKVAASHQKISFNTYGLSSQCPVPLF